MLSSCLGWLSTRWEEACGGADGLIVPARTSVSSRSLGRLRKSLDADCLPCSEARQSGDARFEAMSSRHVQAGALRGRKLHADADADADPKQQFHCSDRRVI